MRIVQTTSAGLFYHLLVCRVDRLHPIKAGCPAAPTTGGGGIRQSGRMAAMPHHARVSKGQRGVALPRLVRHPA